MSDWTSQQRDDLKPCPFCDTAAIEQGRTTAESSTAVQWRIQCGNPFCLMECRTHLFAALRDAVKAWEERPGGGGSADQGGSG